MRHALIFVALVSVGCDWDTYDPRVIHRGVGAQGGSSGEGGSGGNAGGGGDGGAPPLATCGRIDVLQEEFADTITDYLWYSDTGNAGSGSSITESGDTILINSGVDSSYPREALYRGTRRFDLRGGHVGTLLASTPNQSQLDASAFFRIELDDGTWAEFRIANDSIQARAARAGGVVALHVPVAYDPDLHRNMRFREDDSVLYWEVSGDGNDWSELMTAPLSALFPMSRVRALLGAGTNDNTVSAGPAVFEFVRGGPPSATGAWCPMDHLRDDFEDPILSEDWLNKSGASQTVMQELDGQLVLTLPPNTAGGGSYHEYGSSQDYDLNGLSFVLEVVELSAVPATTYMELEHAGNRLIIRVVTNLQNMLQLEGVQISGVLPEEIINFATYNPGQRFWRIREEEDIVYWETSSDGARWAAIGFRNEPFPVDGMNVTFGTTAATTTAAPGQTIFDNVNTSE